VLCVTGGAGVGKTTVLKAIYEVFGRAGLNVFQIALAGRAAQRMQEATGRPASTIASFLKRRDEIDLDAPSALVIDEASMVDIISMSRLCESLPSQVRIVLVGDPHQLAPVGPGLVLQSLLRVPPLPAVELKAAKRYGSEIAAAANAVRFGRWPLLTADDSAPVAFLPCRPDRIAEAVLELVALEPVGTQVLCAIRNGPTGVAAINAACQARLTGGNAPVIIWNREFDCEEYSGFRLGDSVMCTRNRWAIGLQNGSLGTIVDVESIESVRSDDRGLESVIAWISWDDGQRRPLTIELLEDVELGFAVTVHKAQGSQWPRVIIPITASRNLDRSLLYTAFTRAQAQVILVGDERAARDAAIAPPRALDRNVALDLTLSRLLSSSAPAKSEASEAALLGE
jgi:exodeoxyribonuclease V alpha subunit